eukprot:3481791-Amphidinium_carterae.1
MQSWGHRGTPNLAVMATEYRHAKLHGSAEYLLACRVAKAGGVNGRHLQSKSTSCFGIKGREVRRAGIKCKRKAFWQRTRSLPLHERSKQLAEQGDLHGYSVNEAMTFGRTLERLDAKKTRQDLQNAAATLRQFEETLGAEQLKSFLAAVPGLKAQKPVLTPVPVETGVCFAIGPGIEESISQAVAWASSSRTTNLPQGLAREWSARHEPVGAHEFHQGASKENRANTCRLAGMCVCKGSGLQLRKLARAIRSCMKKACPGAAATNPLAYGSIVVQLVSEGTSATIHATGKDPKSYWLHVAAMYFSPYRPTYHALVEAAPGLDGHIPVAGSSNLCLLFKSRPAARIIYRRSCFQQWLERTIIEEREYEAYDKLDRSLQWRVAWWQLENSTRPLPSLDPEYVSVVPLEVQSSQVWPLQCNRKSTRKVPRGHTSAASASSHAVPEVVSDAEQIMELDDSASDEWEIVPAEENENTDLLLRAEILQDWVENFVHSDAGPVQGAAQHTEPEDELQDGSCSGGMPIDDATNAPVVAAESAQSSTIVEVASHGNGLRGPQNPRAAALRTTCIGAEITIQVGTGRLSFYPSKSCFEAVCGNRAHGRCVMSRTNRCRKNGNIGGRPVPFLCCFLENSGVASKQDHFATANLAFPKHKRTTWRRHLEQTPEGRHLLSLERPRQQGEDSEPESLEGYL